MKYNIPQRVQRDIGRLAEKNGIEKVILFGSRAKGTHTHRGAISILPFVVTISMAFIGT